MPNAKVSLLCACAGAALALPGTASAQIEPGVNYDPGSPAGKEYAIPLAEGRSDAAGTTNQRKGENIPFVVGIKPPGCKGGGKRGADDRQAGHPARQAVLPVRLTWVRCQSRSASSAAGRRIASASRNVRPAVPGGCSAAAMRAASAREDSPGRAP